MTSDESPQSREIMAVTLDPTDEACPYLHGRPARFEHYLFLEYGEDAFCRVLEDGFRHFAHYFFRPACPGTAAGGRCGACLPLRVRVADFRPSRSQERVLRRGRAVSVAVARPQFSPEKFEIYLRHKGRFRAGEDSRMTADAFRHAFYEAAPFTWECVYTLEGRPVGAGLIDVAARALSSIYFFFDPAFAGLSPGTLSILYEIALARSLGIPYYYLGYTIHANRSMRYKTDFRPCEFYDGARWRPLREDKAFLADPATLRTGPFTPLFFGAA